MKPINLKIKGINSYVAEQEICFDKLSQSKLFGIFGETGSGKTTILDSIVIALYGSSDRETIPNIINVNSKDAHIYFTFECEQNGAMRTFTVRRDYKVRASGVKTEAIVLDEKTNEVLAEQTDMVNDYILKLVGIGKKEFLKCIALPQGEFDRFLMDTPANRKKTIAKLFNLEDFGANLQEKIRRKRDVVTMTKLNIQDKIAMLGNIDEESIEVVRQNLDENIKQLENAEIELKQRKENYEQLVKNLQLTKELNTKETELVLIKSEKNEIAELKKQIEFTEKYGEYSIKLGKKNNLEMEISKTTLELKDDKELLLNASNELERLDDEIEANTLKLKEDKATLKHLEDNKEKRIACVTSIAQLESQKKLVEQEIENLTDEIDNLKETLSDYKKLVDENEKVSKNLTNTIADNNDILEKLRDVKNVKTIESVLDYINYAKTLVTPESLEEVYQFDIHKEVLNLLNSLSDYEDKTRKQVLGLQDDYNTLSRYNKDLEKLQSDLSNTNGKLIKQNEDIRVQLERIKMDKAVCENQITDKQFALQYAKDKLRNVKSQLEKSKDVLGTLGDERQYDKLYRSVENLTEAINKGNIRKIELNDDKNKTVVSIEVNVTVLENYKKQLKEVEAEIKKLGLKTTGDNTALDGTLYLDIDKLEEAKQNIDDYETKLGLITSKIDELKAKLDGKQVTEEEVKSEYEHIEVLESNIKSYSINVALSKHAFGQYSDTLKKIEALKKEKEKVQKQLDAVNELADLTANGKLLDYVSEEYMQLITQFSNTFVYRISKGKYMLKYSGEFYVVDNFNGGITRGVKTLSGGERFIISLSLALGISQSIAINNNKKFNFFFIDEGFGSLSDNYIENVLNSFDALIRLGFTVGFISHVEKMQSFINNRIVVTKDNNEEGSIIKQYY